MKLNFLSKKPDLLLSKFLNRNSEAGLIHDFFISLKSFSQFRFSNFKPSSLIIGIDLAMTVSKKV
jgi:hypothetical protein